MKYKRIKRRTRKQWMGIRDYISSVLCANRPFNPQRVGRACGPMHGQMNGQFVDGVICEFVNCGNVPQTVRARSIIRRFQREMSTSHLKPLCTQASLYYYPASLMCRTDIIAIDQHTRRKVVIELKSTMYALDDYMKSYNTPCRNQRHMIGGMPNTENNRHMLQVGMAMAAVPSMQGKILIVARDKCRMIDVPQAFANPLYFKRTREVSSLPDVSDVIDMCNIYFDDVKLGPPSLSHLKAVLVKHKSQWHITVKRRSAKHMGTGCTERLRKMAACMDVSHAIIIVTQSQFTVVADHRG